MTSCLAKLRLSLALLALNVAPAHGHEVRHHGTASRSHRHALLSHRAQAQFRHHSSGVTASFYSWRHHGRRMANGERFQPLAMTAASKTLPLGSRVRVTNLANHRSALVLVTDRMRKRGRAIDLSLGAARMLGMQHQGLARVRIQRVA